MAYCLRAAEAMESESPMGIPEPPFVMVPIFPPTPKPDKLVRNFFDVHAVIRAAARRHRVPAAFVKSIVAAESNFDCNAVSPKGAIGLMQLMPETAQQFGVDPTNPEQNIEGGTHYLRILLDKYRKCRDRLKRVIAAYNAGPGAVDRYHGVPPYPETRTYVTRALEFLRQYQKQRA